MNNLTILNQNGQLVTNSREVADMVGKQHPHLLRDIKGYKEVIDQNPNLDSANFFIESTYKNENNQSYPCYLLTKKGCDMVANKMTGEKGVLFTATYVTKFDEMEKQIKTNFKLPTNYKEALLQLVQAEDEKEVLVLGNKQKDQLLGELKPRADYTDNILKNTSLVTITQISKDYGMTAYEMNVMLHNLKIQYKQSDQWLLYASQHDKGYVHSETFPITHKDGRKGVKMNTKWTQKGRLFLYNLLKGNNILPIIENMGAV